MAEKQKSQEKPASQNKGRPTKQRLTPKQIEAERKKLKPGETIYSDGRFVYRMPKSEYDSKNSPPVSAITAYSLTELRKKENELFDSLKRKPINAEKMCVNDLYDMWKRMKRGIEASTFRNYVYCYQNHVYYSHLGNMSITEVKRSTIQRFYSKILDTHTLKPSTLHTLHTCLLQVFDVAVDDQLIMINPVQGAYDKVARVDNQIMRTHQSKNAALDVYEQSVLVQHMLYQTDPNERRWTRLFITLLGTGMRIGELCALQEESIDFQKNRITVEHSLSYFPHKSEEPEAEEEKQFFKSTFFEMHDPKTKAGNREIPMFPIVKSMLIEELTWKKEQNIKCKIHVDGYKNFVFLNRFSVPFDPGYLNSVLKRKISDCNLYNEEHNTTQIRIPMITCHALRHTFACRMLEHKADPLVVRYVMGHADLSTLMNIYFECQSTFVDRELENLEIPHDSVFDEVFATNSDKETSKILQAYQAALHGQIKYKL